MSEALLSGKASAALRDRAECGQSRKEMLAFRHTGSSIREKAWNRFIKSPYIPRKNTTGLRLEWGVLLRISGSEP